MTDHGRDDDYELTPELLLRAYSVGIFPMAESRDDGSVFWVDPRMRGVLPLDGMRIPRSLGKVIRQKRFDVTCDTAFADVIAACAEPRPDHPDTWINAPIERAYTQLHEMGFVHSVECRREGQLVGGLYGVCIGGAFFGESMFSTVTDASKVALIHLVARLRFAKFKLLDVQFETDHLKRFGVTEIPATDYHRRLEKALRVKAQFPVELSEGDEASALAEVLRQSKTQTS